MKQKITLVFAQITSALEAMFGPSPELFDPSEMAGGDVLRSSWPRAQ